MNALQLTALVCLGLVLLFGGLMGAAWIHHCVMHRQSWFRFKLPSPISDLRKAIWLNTWQIALCVLFGLCIAWIYCLGWTADYCR